MTKLREFKMLTGPRANEIFMGFGIGARFYPDGPVDWSKTGDRVWIPDLNQSFTYTYNENKLDKEMLHLKIPRDVNDVIIEKGDTVFVNTSNGITKATVLNIGKLSYNSYHRTLSLMDVNTKRKFTTEYSNHCWKIT